MWLLWILIVLARACPVVLDPVGLVTLLSGSLCRQVLFDELLIDLVSQIVLLDSEGCVHILLLFCHGRGLKQNGHEWWRLSLSVAERARGLAQS